MGGGGVEEVFGTIGNFNLTTATGVKVSNYLASYLFGYNLAAVEAAPLMPALWMFRLLSQSSHLLLHLLLVAELFVVYAQALAMVKVLNSAVVLLSFSPSLLAPLLQYLDPPALRELLEDPRHSLCFSVVSLWELVIKAALGRRWFPGATVVAAAHPAGWRL